MATAAHAVDQLLVPLLSVQNPAVMTEALRAEVAADTANLLVALEMWDTVDQLLDAAAEAACGTASCSGPAAAGDASQGSPNADAATESGNEAAAEAPRWSAAQQLPVRWQLPALAECPGLPSLANSPLPPLPPHAALLLLCQLTLAVADARAGGKARRKGAADDANMTAAGLAATQATQACLRAFGLLLFPLQPTISRWGAMIVALGSMPAHCQLSRAASEQAHVRVQCFTCMCPLYYILCCMRSGLVHLSFRQPQFPAATAQSLLSPVLSVTAALGPHEEARVLRALFSLCT